MINLLFSKIRDITFAKGLIGTIASRVLSLPAFGSWAFKVSVLTKRLLLLMGVWSQRAVEYPWVLKQIESVEPGSFTLDVGCAESLLSHVLIFKKLTVVGLDLRDYPFVNRNMVFVKRNVMDTKLHSDKFDVIIAVSTIEHLGLNVYSQLKLDNNGDVKGIEELRRILKPGGILILTTPYIGSHPIRVYLSERNYNRYTLEKLLKGFQIVKEEYFYPKRIRSRLHWMKMDREKIDQQKFTEPGLACLVLKKL